MERISKDDFEEYERIRLSGKTNMFMVDNIIKLSDNKLTEAKILRIMKDYASLKDIYSQLYPKKYCECSIYLGDGEGKCIFCGLPNNPIVKVMK